MLLSIYSSFLFWSPGPWEIIIIVIVGVVLFGKRLPELGRLIGRSMVSFRKGVTEMKDEIVKAADEVEDASSVEPDHPGNSKETASAPEGVADMPGEEAKESPEDNKPDNA